jgi:glycosyltransferase involved in cell wall biosynthesis
MRKLWRGRLWPPVLDRITPVILTLNEAPNIGRTLVALQWAREVLVLDSGSTDGTPEMAAAFPNVRLMTRAFDTHARQWNAAVGDSGITTEWVLALDADYLLTEAFRGELATLTPSAVVSGYRARFEFAIGGRVLRGSLYPPHVVLFRPARGRYVQDGHTQRLILEGSVEELRHTIIHDDRKPLGRWLASQRRYARHEAERLRALSWQASGLRDRVRKLLVIAPWAVPAYVLAVQGVILDGLAGWRYAAQRALAEVFIASALGRGYFKGRSSW